MAIIPPLSKSAVSININRHTFYGSNRQELIGLKQEIFQEHRYYLELDTDTPTILDGGAHVGLATLYFKTLWPKAKITCLEPHPQNFKYLTHNLWLNRLDDVTTQNMALDNQSGTNAFYADASGDQWFSTAGFINGAWDHTQTSTSFFVSTTTLDQLITTPCDLVKLDIEGAESKVLMAAHHSLPLIKHLIIEYHPNREHSLDELLTFLKKHQLHPILEKNPPKPHQLTIIHAINLT
jgi:FkbM family methyltransferase